MQVLQQGPGYLHAILPQIEEGITHFLTVANSRTTLHRILQTGEVVSTEVNLPYLRAMLQAVDSVVPTE